MTRAVSGFSGLLSHSANQLRLVGVKREGRTRDQFIFLRKTNFYEPECTAGFLSRRADA
jgi:hypothetical protein